MTATWNNTRVRIGSAGAAPEALRFLQQRVALLAAVLGLVAGTFFVVSWVTSAFETDEIEPGDFTARAVHAGGTLLMVAAWLLARRDRLLSPTALAALDATIVIAACVSWSVMGSAFGNVAGVYTAVLASAFTCIGRAILVPTTVRRTLSTTALALAPLPIVGATASGAVEASTTFLTVQASVWAGSALAIAALTSRVVYGLHEQVQEARRLGQYTLEEKIGQGGMGEVYRARHAMLRRPTAVKLLSATDAHPVRLRRFEREVQRTSELTHPNTIIVYDYGHTPDGVFYYAMEYLDGMDLAALVSWAGPLPAGRVIHLLGQVCGALGEAHAVGLIHRDIKPENVVVGARGGIHDFVKVLDFGLVKEVERDADAGITAEGMIMGTPHYMAPEAILGRELDARSDLYGVGCLGYYLLTGVPVFEGSTIMEVCAGHLHREPEPLSKRRPEVPPDLEARLMACLEKDPSRRPESAARLAADLAACACAGEWDQAGARAWWERAQTDRPAEQEIAEGPTLAAVEVDRARRAGGGP